MSGPVAGMLGALLAEMSGRNEMSMFISDDQRRSVVSGLFENFYAPETRAEVVFDTNRSWTARLPALRQLMPESRVIACVRDLHWIMDSVERLVRKNAFSPSSIFNYSSGGTVYTRANGLAAADGLVGYAFDALKEAFYGEDTEQLMLVQYDSLVREPARVMQAIYHFIGEPAFQHDFENVQYDAREFDLRSGTPGLHDVRAKVELRARESILPPDLIRRFENDAFWTRAENNLRQVRII
jgi:sulfotransferase